MSVDITLTFTDDDIDELLADGYTHLKVCKGTWTPGSIGLAFAWAAADKTWTLVDGTTVYEWTDDDGHADRVYQWAPWEAVGGVGPIRPAFEPNAVRLSSLLIALSQQVDPTHFVYSTLSGATDADTFQDAKVTEPDDFFNDHYLLMLTGNRATQWRQIEDWDQSSTEWELSRELSGSPAQYDEYLVLPFVPDAGLMAIQRAISDAWPRQARRIEDSTVLITTGEQVYDIPAPIEVVERVEYLPDSDSARPIPLSFQQLAERRFRLMAGYPSEDTVLRVTGRAPLSIPYTLDDVTELSYPAQTAAVLARAELKLRSDPSSGLMPDQQRMTTLQAEIGQAESRFATRRIVPIYHAIE